MATYILQNEHINIKVKEKHGILKFIIFESICCQSVLERKQMLTYPNILQTRNPIIQPSVLVKKKSTAKEKNQKANLNAKKQSLGKDEREVTELFQKNQNSELGITVTERNSMVFPEGISRS